MTVVDVPGMLHESRDRRQARTAFAPSASSLAIALGCDQQDNGILECRAASAPLSVLNQDTRMRRIHLDQIDPMDSMESMMDGESYAGEVVGAGPVNHSVDCGLTQSATPCSAVRSLVDPDLQSQHWIEKQFERRVLTSLVKPIAR